MRAIIAWLEIGDHKNGSLPLSYSSFMLVWPIYPSVVHKMLHIAVTTHVCLLHASMVVHLYDLYYEFRGHSCGPYFYRQLWSVPKVALGVHH